MAIDDKIRDKKLRYNISRAAAKISALLSRKIDKNKYLTGKEITFQLKPNNRTSQMYILSIRKNCEKTKKEMFSYLKVFKPFY